jgi:hypothetical protein
VKNPFEWRGGRIPRYEFPVEVFENAKSQDVIDAREANREAMNERRREQEAAQRRLERAEKALEYLRSSKTERQRKLDAGLRALNQVAGGQWSLRNTTEAIDEWTATFLAEAQGAARAAVKSWAETQRQGLKAAQAAAEDERKDMIRRLEEELAGRR